MRIIKSFFLIFLSVLFFLSPAFAQTSIKADVDKTRITTDETLTYKVIVTSSQKQIPEPKPPDFKDFNVISQANSSTISFLNNGIKTILVYVFILAPTKTGKIEIGQSTIKIEDQTYATQSFQIEVTEGEQPLPNPEQKPKFHNGLPFELESDTPRVTL